MLNVAFGEETMGGGFGSSWEDRKISSMLKKKGSGVRRNREDVMAKNTVAKDAEETAPSDFIDRKIAELGDWRGETLAHIRAVIRKAADIPVVPRCNLPIL